MKSQKGITLVTVTIYIIAMTVAVAIMTVISGYFYKNVDITNSSLDPLTEYTKFTGFFSDEVNHSNIEVLGCEENYIVFSNNVQYTFIEANNGIYRNKVKICRNVEKCQFEYTTAENGKGKVTATVKMINGEEKTVEYILK